MTVDIERELKLYSPKKNPLESVRLPPLAAIGPAVMGRLPDEGYADCTEWLSSPVPGFRTQPKLDPTRTIACSEKNSLIYRQDCGLIPKVLSCYAYASWQYLYVFFSMLATFLANVFDMAERMVIWRTTQKKLVRSEVRLGEEQSQSTLVTDHKKIILLLKNNHPIKKQNSIQ